MQISLRSQMIAGTTAVVGAAAIAMTPMAPAVNLPALSPTKAAVQLAALDNPFAALAGTVGAAVSYILSGTPVDPTDPAFWPGANFDLVTPGVANVLDGVLAAQGVLNVGIIPNFLSNPLPIATQITSNVLGYVNEGVVAGGAALAALSGLAWLPVSLGGTILNLVLAGDIADIPAAISAAITESITAITDTIDVAVTAATNIFDGLATNVTNVLTALAAGLPQLVGVVANSVQAVSATLTNVFTQTATGFGTGGLEGGWNALVQGLLSVNNGSLDDPTDGTYGLTLPGTLLGLTLGGGVQFGVIDPTDPEGTVPTAFAPSIRTVVTGLQTTVAAALTPGYVPPAASARVRPAAASVAAKPAAAKKSVGRHAAAARSAAAK